MTPKMPARSTLLTHTKALALLLTLVLLVAGATPARAAVLDADYVGGTKVSDSPALRSKAPDLYIPSGVLSTMDGRELWARDPESRRAMASTTKIMTAVVVLERANLNAMVTVDRTASKVGESAMGLVPGEKLTVGELLKGVLVQSGNDAATLIAEAVGGSTESFVQMMNSKAAQLDLINTAYVNPHGLDAKGHYTSAEDLTVLARYAMRSPVFRELVGTKQVKVRSDHYTHVLTSHNTMLKTYKGAEGIKTGWTDDAGYCIVVAAKRGDIELVGTVMGAASEGGRAQQAKRLLDWGFAHYRTTTVVTAGEALGRVRVSDYLERTVRAQAAETTAMPVFDLAGPVSRRVELQADVPAPVTKGDVLGTMTLYQGDAVLAQVPVVASADIPAPSVWQRVVFFFARIWRGTFGS
jgi:D-alanyl-D-alanine carboxypeptidase (penicillin-binding protein 5/6)